MLVRDVMAVPAVTCRPEEPLEHCARLLLERDVGAVIVVDRHGEALGIVTAADVTERPASRLYNEDVKPIVTAAPLAATSLEDLREDLRLTPARKAMQRPLHFVRDSDEVERALDLMVQHGIHHVPVVLEGRPIGMLSRREILKALLHEVATAM